METSGRRKFPSQKWVLQLLKNEFLQPCNCPLAKECNLYCNDCLGTPFCKSCKSTHEGHAILQICKTSRRDSVHARELNYLSDVSGIQRVTMNGAKVVYLKPSNNHNNRHNGLKSGGRINGNNNGNRCECCNAKLLQGNYRFCSVFCKSFIVILFNEDDLNRNCSDNITEINGGSKRRKEKYLSVMTTSAMKSNRLHSSGNIIENVASKKRKEKYLSITTTYAMISNRLSWK